MEEKEAEGAAREAAEVEGLEAGDYKNTLKCMGTKGHLTLALLF